MSSEATTASHPDRVPLVVRSCRRPRQRAALHGVKLGLRSHSGFAVHIFSAALIVAGAITLSCEVWEWAILLGGLGGLFAAELFNDVVRQLMPHIDSMPEDERERCRAMAAGAVLVIRLTAMGLALLLFGHRIVKPLQIWG
ncbi:diacylglycerol kinase [Zavarzinella formosa]|uniref:diacylglycerol kinase n=1 Tax=Zavarzinella formosa TaxID=360055 RepID=UPI00036DEBC6|nr:diacylglycerol kinase [Zavarzinella formosa]